MCDPKPGATTKGQSPTATHCDPKALRYATCRPAYHHSEAKNRMRGHSRTSPPLLAIDITSFADFTQQVSTLISLRSAWQGISLSTALCDAIPGGLVAFARFLAWRPSISHAPRVIAPSTTTPVSTASLRHSSSPAPTTTDAILSCAEFNNPQRYNATSIWPHWTPMRPQRDGLRRRNYAGDNMTDTRCV